MATYKQIGYGSQGSEVTELQKLLNQNGYTLDADGIFGSKTQSAVRDYQQKNSLAVDGIVGNNTWGALTKAPSTSAPAATQPETAQPATPDANTESKGFAYGAYQPSDTVAQAEALLQQQMAQKPGAYQSTWQDQLNETINQILNRDKFSYDLNGDALYQQYADQYMRQGKMAMMDTMGQAQAMTGGYGNSYAQSAGQQAYQGYLQQLNEVVPELYGMALDQYNREGQALYDQAALMGQQEDQDYGRYQDELNRWQSERDYQTGRFDAERDYDYGKWADGRDFGYDQYLNDLAFQYQQERDKVSDQQWQSEFDEAKRQYDQQYGLAASKGSGGSGGSGGGNDNGSGSDNGNTGGLSKEAIKNVQRSLGVEADGIWGPVSQKAAGGLSAEEAYKLWNQGQLGKPVGLAAQMAQALQGANQQNNNSGGFTGTSYSDATAYIKSNGGSASGLMTSSEWARHRNSYLQTGKGNAEAANYSSYTEYLKDFVEYATQ